MTQPNTPERIWKYNQVLYAEVIDALNSHFEAIKARYMPIKGAYLICSGLAEKMPYRRMDDIDILVKREDFERVCEYFSNLPQVTFLKHECYFETEFIYSIGSLQWYFEIHWQLSYPARFNLPTSDLFHRAVPSNGMRVLPCGEDAMIILLCHAFVHIAYEIRDTLFMEIALISATDKFSWAKFWEVGATTGITSFFNFIFFCYEKETACGKHDDVQNFLVRSFAEPHAPSRRPWLRLKLKNCYARLLAKLMGLKGYKYLPFFIRRLFVEFPFMYKPLLMIKARLSALSRNCKRAARFGGPILFGMVKHCSKRVN
jgi:hypothetical protein